MQSKSKSIIKLSLITLSIILGLIIIILTIGVFCFTESFAKLSYSCGLYSISSSLYDLQYKNTADINYIVKACNIDIESKNYSSYIKHYEKFESDKEYSNYIEFLNNNNYSNNKLSILAKSSLVNEDNYYKNKYVYALINEKLYEKAVTYATCEWNYNIEINYLNPSVYLLHYVIDNQSTRDILLTNNEMVENLILYYEELCIYYQDVNNVDDLDIVYFVNFCNYCITLSSDILKLDSFSNIIDEDKENVIIHNIAIFNNNISSYLGA